MFPKLLSVIPVQKYKLALRFEDGVEGLADVSHLAGRGVFQEWEIGELFFKVSIDPETNALVWNESLDLDPDSLYLQIKGLTFEQLKKQSQAVYAAN